MKIGRLFIRIFFFIFLAFVCFDISAQSLFDEIIYDGETVSADTALVRAEESGALVQPKTQAPTRKRAPQRRNPRKPKTPSLWDLTDSDGFPLDSTMFGPQELWPDSLLDVSPLILPKVTFIPPIFYNYSTSLAADRPDMLNPATASLDSLNWADRAVLRNKRYELFMQDFMIARPDLVPYNIADMPQVPKEYVVEVDPQQAKITVTEFTRDIKEMTSVAKPVELKHINWLHNFDGSLQFSQAYISPNWYQGGKSNLNGILNLFYNVKLNQAFHPNLMFETSMQYKLGVNNAPDDTIHSYNITEDLFQINSKFGLKAAKRWYYSINAQFKTQLLNNYRVNTDDLTAAFLSPGELNVGVGMTYNYENPRKTVNFSAVISPLSYNMKMCTNSRLNETAFGIEEGKKTVSQYGSSAELTFKAKLAWNIEYFSRLFMFTNYEYVQGDWENTLTFNFNRFLSTKVFAHLRYQSDTPRLEDTKWQKWQLKEIISIGFSYKFSRS